MKTIKLLLAGLAMASATAWAQDCTAPDVPELPDGKTASYDDMIAGQGAVKAFQADNLEYMNCMEPLITNALAAAQGESATDEDKARVKALEEAYNAAVSREEELAGAFNNAIRAYKEANPG
jgi:hypothetical protein